MGDRLGSLASPVPINSEVSDSESGSDYDANNILENESEATSDSPVYAHKELPSNDILELRHCNVVSEEFALVGHVESEFSDPILSQQQILMPGVKSQHKRRKTSGPLTPFHKCVPSILQERDIPLLRQAYNIPNSVSLRVPSGNEKAHNSGPDEIVVYETFFSLGMRGAVPPLIATVARFFNISPGQFTPSAWRVLTAIQVLGEFSSTSIGMNELLYVYYFQPDVKDSSRCAIHTRSNAPLVHDLDKSQIRRLPYLKDWRSRYMFMRVGHDPDFPVDWFFRDFSFPSIKEGEAGALRLISRPTLERSVYFLVSYCALEKSSIWGYTMSSNEDVPAGESALATFRRLHAEDLDDVIIPIEEPPTSRTSSRRPIVVADNPRPTSKTLKRKNPGASHGGDLLAISDHSTTLVNLNREAFSQDRDGFAKLGYSTVLDESQNHLFKVMSACHYTKTELDNSRKENTRLQSTLSKAHADLISERERHNAAMAAKDEEYRSMMMEFEALKVTEQGLQMEARRHAKKLLLAMSVATIKNTWKMVQEYKDGVADKWDAREAEEHFREVSNAEADKAGRVRENFPDSFKYDAPITDE